MKWGKRSIVSLTLCHFLHNRNKYWAVVLMTQSYNRLKKMTNFTHYLLNEEKVKTIALPR